MIYIIFTLIAFISYAQAGSILLNFTSDYKTGKLIWFNDIASLEAADGNLSFFQDSKIKVIGENIYVLERIGFDNISCIPAKSLNDPKSIKQKSLEDNSNPYDIAVIGEKGYIAFNNADYLQIINPSACELEDKIDLPIKKSNASAIVASGDTLFVAMQRLNEKFVSTKPGLLALINAKTKTIIDTIQMNFYNPHSMFISKGKLYISSVRYNPDDPTIVDKENCGIEAMDLATHEFETIYNKDGGVSEMAFDEENEIIYASVYLRFGTTPVLPISITSKTAGNRLPGITDSYNGLVYYSETAKVFSTDTKNLKVYDVATKKTATINTALPSYSLAIVKFEENSPIRRHIVYANLTVKTLNNAIQLGNLPANAKIEVFNLSGRRINILNSGNSQILKIQVQAKGMYIVKINNMVLRVPVM